MAPPVGTDLGKATFHVIALIRSLMLTVVFAIPPNARLPVAKRPDKEDIGAD